MVNTIKHFIDVFVWLNEKMLMILESWKKKHYITSFNIKICSSFKVNPKMVSYHVSLEINLTHFGLGDDTP
jgi:hypothetical protein